MTRVDPSAIFEHNLARYDTPWSQVEYASDRAHPAEAALVSTFFPPAPARVLDIGCGAGRSTVALSERGYSVVAIDLSEALLTIARDRHPALDFRAMDATRLQFDADSFDAALFSYNGLDVIYPLAGRLACVAEVQRVLRPLGAFVMSTHNAIGAVCCGGFFYPLGYLNAARFLGNQITNPVAREWYFRYRDGGGEHFLFSAPPARTIEQLASAGFDILTVCGDDAIRGQSVRHITTRYQHVHIAARKR
jgi:ubiquinone/menaquinone biosynthesis C-methylase UbiE